MNKNQRIEQLEHELSNTRMKLYFTERRVHSVRSLIEGQRHEQLIPIGSVYAALNPPTAFDE